MDTTLVRILSVCADNANHFSVKLAALFIFSLSALPVLIASLRYFEHVGVPIASS